MYTLIVFLVVLSLLVFAHEFGHFFAARRLGVKVLEFGFGFPPRIWSFKRKETVYSINWIPVGGFVKLKGEAGEDKDDKDSFAGKPAWARALIMVAGVAMNFVLAAVLFSIGFMAGLPQAVDNLPAGAVAHDLKIGIAEVLPDSPAAKAGIMPGDILNSIDNQKFNNTDEVRSYLSDRGGVPVQVKVTRFIEEKTFEVIPGALPDTDRAGLGVGLLGVATVSYPWYLAPVRGVEMTFILTREITKAFGGIIYGLVTEGRAGVEISGPVGIAVLSGQAAELGLVYLLQFIAILSINLAIINVLPFPALDGGRLLFLLIEKIGRRPVPVQVENFIHQVGFLLLLALVVAVTYRDLIRFSDTILGGLRSLF